MTVYARSVYPAFNSSLLVLHCFMHRRPNLAALQPLNDHPRGP